MTAPIATNPGTETGTNEAHILYHKGGTVTLVYDEVAETEGVKVSKLTGAVGNVLIDLLENHGVSEEALFTTRHTVRKAVIGEVEWLLDLGPEHTPKESDLFHDVEGALDSMNALKKRIRFEGFDEEKGEIVAVDRFTGEIHHQDKDKIFQALTNRAPYETYFLPSNIRAELIASTVNVGGKSMLLRSTDMNQFQLQ